MPFTINRTDEPMNRLDRTLSELAETQRRNERDIAELSRAANRLHRGMRKLQGYWIERRCRVQATAYFGTIVRRTHVLSDDERWDIFDAAMDRGLLSLAEVRDISLADVLVRGLTLEDGRQVYLVVEASLTIRHEDVERAARRASLFARAGVEAIPVVKQWPRACRGKRGPPASGRSPTGRSSRRSNAKRRAEATGAAASSANWVGPGGRCNGAGRSSTVHCGVGLPGYSLR